MTEILRQLERVVTDAPDELFNMHVIEAKVPCGTARCAFGWTLIDPWFLANTNVLEAHKRLKIEALGLVLGETFGIRRIDADYLFGSELSGSPTDRDGRFWRNVTKLEVIANIHRLQRGEPTKPYRATRP